MDILSYGRIDDEMKKGWCLLRASSLSILTCNGQSRMGHFGVLEGF